MTSNKVLREILFSLLEICERQERAICQLQASVIQHSEPKSVVAARELRAQLLSDIRIELCIEEGIANMGDCE